MRTNILFKPLITTSLLMCLSLIVSFVNAEEIKQLKTEAVVANASEGGPRSIIDKGFFLQLGAFESEENSNQLSNKVNGFKRDKSVELFKLYNDGIYQVKLGPYETRKAADLAIEQIRQQYNIKAIIKNHF